MDAVVEATGAGTVTVIGGAARFDSRLADRFLDSRGSCRSVW